MTTKSTDIWGNPIVKTPAVLFEEGDIDGLFDYYRRAGFPQYQPGGYNARRELEKVISAPADEYYHGGIYTKYQSANGFLFSYFPHWIDVRCGNSPSLREAWETDALLRGCIEKTINYCRKHGEDWSTNRIRQNAKVYCAKQTVSNFNPVCARLLYDEFAPGGTVYDMSMGWGGRLLGFYASSAVRYIGTDPSIKTFCGLQELNADLYKVNRREKHTWLFHTGSEKFNLVEGVADFCFTSPPYFDTERYSNEDTQSYIAFPTPASWKEGFLRETIRRCYSVLKDRGYLAINIADTPKCKVSGEIVQMAEAVGFKYKETRQYELSSVTAASNKTEPIYVFTKGEVQGPAFQDTLF